MEPNRNSIESQVLVRLSPYDFADTISRLKVQITAHGAKIFAVVDHAAGAEGVGLSMPPTVTLIFGNPAVGTPVMLKVPDMALDLPSRVLVRETSSGVEVVFMPLITLAARHRVTETDISGLAGMITIIDDALSGQIAE